jgi:hypothetical protein
VIKVYPVHFDTSGIESFDHNVNKTKSANDDNPQRSIAIITPPFIPLEVLQLQLSARSHRFS